MHSISMSYIQIYVYMYVTITKDIALYYWTCAILSISIEAKRCIEIKIMQIYALMYT